MMRADYLLRSSLPNQPWPTALKPQPMETDGNNDSGVSPGRSSETNSNSPNFANSPQSPDGMITSPGESSVENRSEKGLSPHLKIEEPYQFYCDKNRTYSPPNFGFTLSQQENDTPKKWGINDISNNSNREIANMKIDNISEKSNDCGYEKNEVQTENSLERLKDALEKSSALSRIFKTKADDSDSGNEVENGKKEFPCPLCAYTTPYRHRYIEHLSTHYSDKCTLCDFTGQNSQDLRSHLQEMHNISNIHDLSDPQENNSDYQEEDEPISKRGKSKKFKCKQCNYVTSTKLAFWKHSKSHIKAEKQLTCPKCPFVTEYKHHLEYHLRNHFGSKPFQCDKCSYTCVNKSMLNSHMKSHSNVYQYRCADCVYATKYCHSLKLHLRKYRHKPAMVLNADGSPNPLPIIDVYGTRRGPKQKPNKVENDNRNIFLDIRIPDKERIAPNLPGGIIVPNAPQISPKSPNSLFSLNNNEVKDDDSWNILNPKVYYCSVCDFQSKTQEFLDLHTSNHSSGSNSGQSSKTNNNLQEQNIKKDYFQAELLKQPTDHIPLNDSRSNTPLSLVQPKIQQEEIKQPISPLDLSKQESVELEIEVGQDLKKKEEEINGNSNKSTKRRRKGKAYKLERINDDVDFSLEDYYKGKSDEDSNVIVIPELKPKIEEVAETIKENAKAVYNLTNENKKTYDCIYCDIVFKDVVLYTMHMGYHGFQDPFTCNMCGHITLDKVSFFLHIARSSHS